MTRNKNHDQDPKLRELKVESAESHVPREWIPDQTVLVPDQILKETNLKDGDSIVLGAPDINQELNEILTYSKATLECLNQALAKNPSPDVQALIEDAIDYVETDIHGCISRIKT